MAVVAHSEVNLPQVFSCLLGEDRETGLWAAHCLNFDLVTSGKTEDEAWKRLLRVVKMHVEHCFAHHQEGFSIKADESYWASFNSLKEKRQDLIRSEKIALTLIPQPKNEADFF